MKLIKRILKYFTQYQAAFIHIPKTGGSSMIKIIQQHTSKVRIIGHGKPKTKYKLYYERECFNKEFSFCFVRNPLDRAVSAFFYLNELGMAKYDSKYAEKYIIPYKGDFNEFVRHEFPKKEIFNQIHFIPQHTWISNQHGNICVNYVAKMENIEKESRLILKLFGIKNFKLLKINTSKKKDIKIEDDVIELIENHYAKDYELFKYNRTLQ